MPGNTELLPSGENNGSGAVSQSVLASAKRHSTGSNSYSTGAHTSPGKEIDNVPYITNALVCIEQVIKEVCIHLFIYTYIYIYYIYTYTYIYMFIYI